MTVSMWFSQESLVAALVRENAPHDYQSYCSVNQSSGIDLLIFNIYVSKPQI